MKMLRKIVGKIRIPVKGKPEIGKLIVFSNSQYLHYVSKVEGDERFVLSFWYNSLNK